MTPLQEWVVRLAREAATVEIVACHYAPGTHHHGDLIGITSEGATLPFCGCKSAKQVEAEQQDRRIRYAGNSITKPNTTELNEIQTRTNRLAFKR